MENIIKHFEMDGYQYDMHIVKKNENNSFEVFFFKSNEKVEDVKKEKSIHRFTMKRITNLD